MDGAIFEEGGVEGGGQLDDWTDSIVGIVDDMNERLDEGFEDVRNTIIGGMPTTADYEQIADLTRTGLGKIIAAQDLYLEDLNSWIIAKASLEGRVSADTMAWFEGLDTATQGGFGRLFAESPAVFEQFVADLEANFAEAEIMTGNKWNTMLPGQMQAAFQTAISILSAETDKLGVTGEQTVDAFVLGIQTQMAQFGELGPEYMEFLNGIFGSEQAAIDAGFDVGLPWVQGFILALAQLSEMADPVITREIDAVNERLNQVAQIDSPSKLTYYTGKMMGMGIIHGFEDTLRGWNPDIIKAQFQPKIESLIQPVVNLQTMAPQKHISIKIDHAEPGPVSRDLQAAGILGNVLANT